MQGSETNCVIVQTSSNDHSSSEDEHNKVNLMKRKFSVAHKYNQINTLLAKCAFFSDFISTKFEQTVAHEGSSEDSNKSKRKNLDDENANFQANKVRKLNDGTSKVQDDSVTTGGSEVHILGHIVHVKQPSLLEGGELRDYQLQGLRWMILLFENGLNGILADEMGLGKTIQIISLLCHLYGKNITGPFLIIGPVSTLANWKNEINLFAPKLPVLLYHGPMPERVELRKNINAVYDVGGTNVFPVVITSFEVAIRDKAYLSKYKWKYLIVDEGHRLKNFKSVLFRTLSAFPKVNSLLLTGTPLQNNLSELWSLLHFILPDVFDELGSFNEWLVAEELDNCESYLSCLSHEVIEEEHGTSMLSALHKIIRPFMLRRVKADVSLELPPKKELVIYCPLADIQLDLSRHVFQHVNGQSKKPTANDLIIPNNPDGSRPKRHATQKSILTNNKSNESQQKRRASKRISTDSLPSISVPTTSTISNTDLTKNYSIKWNNISMLLRKIANHPYLLQNPRSLPMTTNNDIIKQSGKMLVLDTLLQKLKERGHKVLLFSNFTSMLNVIEDFLILRNYSYKRLDGQTKYLAREQQINEFNSDNEVFVFLISTRAGGLGINLVSADTVVLFDSDWNPQADQQAQDRCHRIGQTKPVLVYRFVSKGTIEDHIVNRATSKLKLEKLVISKGSFKHSGKMRDISDLGIDIEELKTQLNINKVPVYIHENGSVLRDEEWDNLLDRSQMKH